MGQYEPEVHLSEYVRVIKNRKNIIITFFFTTVLIVTIGSFLMQPIYRAAVTLLIDEESPNVLTTTGSVAMGNVNYYAYKEYFQSQKAIIRSHGILRRVFEEFNLGENKEYKNAKDPIKQFFRSVRVEPVRDTRLLMLYVDNKDPRLAAEICNRIAELYVAGNLAYITKSEIMNLFKNEYLKLQTKLSEYTKVYKHKHPKMIRLKQELAQMVDKIRQEKERAVDYDVGNFYTSRVDSEISRSVLSGLKANNVTIQDAAEIPIDPIKPKKRLNILLSIVVGLFGGFVLAFFFEYLDDTVKGLEDVQRLVKWPFLGHIPDISKESKVTEIEKDLFAETRPKDPIVEAYRTVRTSVLFSATEEHPLESVLITSPGPREGKTITLCNMGIVMAQSYKKVLLVDADMRKPRLQDVFKQKNDIGLSNFLSGQAKFEGIVKETGIKALSMICGGPNPPNPSELLASHKMKEFIEKAQLKYDIVLFDTAPMAVVTDAVILSSQVDGTIIVLESGKTNRKVLPRFGQIMEDAKAHVVGVILNRISVTGSNYYYYHYYYGNER